MQKRPLELLEESLQLLCGGGTPVLVLHWTGNLPFAVALLWLLRDTSFAWGGALLLRDSLLCGLAFIWMSYWKNLASQNTLLLLAPGGAAPVTWLNRLAAQTIFQTPKLFVMPLAMASIVAWPAVSVFFRTLALEPVSNVRPIRSGWARAFAAATRGYRENAVAFLTAAAFAVIICLNVLVTFALLPSLWKMLTGYETDWSRLENAGMIFSLFAVAAITTWLFIDPWLETYSILRVFYQNARSDGRDLLRAISGLAAIVLFCLLLAPAPARASQVNDKAQQTLNQAIDHASKDIDYGWLRPRDTSAPSGFLGTLATSVNHFVASAKDQIARWYRSFVNWLRDVFGQGTSAADDAKRGKPRTQELRWTLAVLAVLLCGVIIALFLRSGKVRTVAKNSTAGGGPAADVLNDQLLASDVNQEEWLRLAFEYLANNQTRLAARAFYLANLSYLGGQRMLALSLWKSNRLYERELSRQPKSSELSAAFAAGNRLYERAWYGMRELGAEQMELIKGAADQLRQHA